MRGNEPEVASTPNGRAARRTFCGDDLTSPPVVTTKIVIVPIAEPPTATIRLLAIKIVPVPIGDSRSGRSDYAPRAWCDR